MPQAPILYIPHGGGPMPVLGDPAQAALSRFLRELGASLPRPEAIVVISAHWEMPGPAVYADSAPGMLYDYGGFPPEAYQLQYPAPGNPQLAGEIQALLQAQGLECEQVQGRGFDHGLFVPLLLLFPEADIPCLQLSLLKSLDPAEHLALGKALASLPERNIMLLGSGMSFHNLPAIFAGPRADYQQASSDFADWLNTLLCDEAADPAARLAGLRDWQQAPAASFCHPRPEHLLPLHVCAGAAAGRQAALLFDEAVMGHRVAGYGWS